MATISINGTSIQGSSITINGNRITVDGKDQTPDTKIINVEVHGDIETLTADYCQELHVAGNAGKVSTMSGDVHCAGNILGNVKTMSGDVNANVIEGDVETMSGDILGRN